MIIDPYLMAELVRSRQADCLAMANPPRARRVESRRPLGRARLVAGERLIQLGQRVCGCATAPANQPELA